MMERTLELSAPVRFTGCRSSNMPTAESSNHDDALGRVAANIEVNHCCVVLPSLTIAMSGFMASLVTRAQQD